MELKITMEKTVFMAFCQIYPHVSQSKVSFDLKLFELHLTIVCNRIAGCSF